MIDITVLVAVPIAQSALCYFAGRLPSFFEVLSGYWLVCQEPFKILTLIVTAVSTGFYTSFLSARSYQTDPLAPT